MLTYRTASAFDTLRLAPFMLTDTRASAFDTAGFFLVVSTLLLLPSTLLASLDIRSLSLPDYVFEH